jgi:hypothetical protein
MHRRSESVIAGEFIFIRKSKLLKFIYLSNISLSTEGIYSIYIAITI